MKRLLVGAVLALSLAANVTVLVLAVRAQSVQAQGAGAGLPVLAKVALDARQRERIGGLRREFVAFRTTNLARTGALRAELAALLLSDAPDRARIEVVLGQISESQGALQRRVVEQVLAVRAALRPDQRPVFEEMMTRHLSAGVPLRGPSADEGPCWSAP